MLTDRDYQLLATLEEKFQTRSFSLSREIWKDSSGKLLSREAGDAASLGNLVTAGKLRYVGLNKKESNLKRFVITPRELK